MSGMQFNMNNDNAYITLNLDLIEETHHCLLQTRHYSRLTDLYFSLTTCWVNLYVMFLIGTETSIEMI